MIPKRAIGDLDDLNNGPAEFPGAPDIKGENSRVFVVEDDPSMRTALKNLLRSAGFEPQLFNSAYEFLHVTVPDLPSCLILDIGLPGLSGLDLQRELSLANIQIPIIFITAQADDFVLIRAMEAGAVGVFTKPFCDRDLLSAIHRSLRLERSEIPKRSHF